MSTAEIDSIIAWTYSSDGRPTQGASFSLAAANWKRLTSDDAATRLAAASAFVGYELSISKTFVEDKIIRECLETPSQLVPFAVMEVSYMLNAGFMSRGQLIAEVGKLFADSGTPSCSSCIMSRTL